MTLALILKEWKSLGRWALLAGVLIGLGLVGVLFGNRPTTIVTDDFLAIAGMALWAAALVAGLGVMLADLRRGHFAFAVFRPLPRWRNYLAKFLAAALLYGVASTIAVSIAAIGASQPRLTYRPFDVAMLLPTLYLQIGGLAWVACGMVIAARRASWIGSRLFPAALPGAMVALGLTVFSSFAAAVLVMLITTAVLLAVGCAYFTANGEHRRVAWWAKPIAGLCVLGGVAFLIGGGFGLASEILTSALGGRNYGGNYRYESYRIGDNGEAIRSVSDGGVTHFYDLNGNLIARPYDAHEGHDDRHDIPPATNPATAGVLRQRGVLATVNYRDPDTAFHYRHFRDSFLTQANYSAIVWTNDTRDWNWYWMPRRRTVEAYTLEGRYVGCLGPDGAFDTTGRRLPFPADTYRLPDNGRETNGFVLHTDTVAYLVMPDERKVRTIFTSTPAEPILDATMLHVADDANWRHFASGKGVPVNDLVKDLIRAMEPRVAAVTPGKLHVQAVDGGGWMVLPLPKEPTPYIEFVAFPRRGPTTPDLALLTHQRFSDSNTALLTLRDGVVASQSLPAIPWPISLPRTWVEDLWNVAVPPALIGVELYSILSLPGVDWTSVRVGVWHLFSRQRNAFFIVGLVVGVVGTLLLTRRYRMDRRSTLTWLGLSLLFGIHTPLTLVCLRERPRRIACPACGKNRPIEEAACPHCRAAWPVPGNAATDVIEASRAA